MKFVSIDSSLTNTGLAFGTVEKGRIIVEDTLLIVTKKSSLKSVRASSDTISRCRQTYLATHGFIQKYNPKVIFAETPSGSQSASGAKSYGTTCMLIASIYLPPIEVTPQEVKKAVPGLPGSKASIIEWAVEKYPHLNWHRFGSRITKNNEHVADAILIAHAGIETPEFARVRFSQNI